ncbi:hypothetical protein Tco_1160835 [Tanacetum coccineum]
MIQDISGGCQGEGSELRKDTQDNKDSIDSDQTLSATTLDDDVNLNGANLGDLDKASNYIVFVHVEKKKAKEKQTLIFITLNPLRTGSSQDDVSRTSGLNSRERSTREEKPCGNSTDLDRLHELQTVIIPEVTMTEPIRPDQRGSTRVNSVLITPNETLTSMLNPERNPKLTGYTLGASENPSDVLAPASDFQILSEAKQRKFNLMAKKFKDLKEQVMEQHKRMDDFIAFKVPDAVEESLSTHAINEVKNQVLTLVPDAITDFIQPCIHNTVLHVLRTE